MFFRVTSHVLVATIAGFGFASSALAQDYPTKAVKVIVPFAPGGNTDTIGRIVSERLQAALGQPFVVENRTGAGGAIAADFVAKAPADGYTLFVSSVGQIAIVPVLQRVGYNPAKDFAPISNVGTNPFVLGVHVSVPAKDVKEFVAHLKANAGKLHYASGGNGSISHLSAALFVMRAGADMIHVPYKGGAPAVADLVGGQVAMYFGNASDLLQHARSGKVRMIGVSSEKRAAQLPDVPAIAETFPGFSTITWNGLLAPAGTPAAIVERLSREVQRIAKEPAVIERLQKIGVDPLGSNAADFAKTIQSDIALYKGIVQDAKIRVD